MPRPRLADRRLELGHTQEDIADLLRVAVNTYSRYERGEITPSAARRLRLAEVLEWSPQQLSVALGDDLPPINGHEVPGWLNHLSSLEQAAGLVSAWEPFVVLGLLQTPDYALAVEQADTDDEQPAAIAKRVEARMARASAVVRDDGPLRLSVVLDESVLMRVAGGPEVMAGQLGHLVELAERPNVELRVLPLTAGRFAAAFGAFYLFTQTGATAPYMAVTEDRAGPHYLDRPHELHAHSAVFAHLSEAALPAEETVLLIEQQSKEYR